ncbi:hypothetical protein [Lewinella sp. LCG006]|uniref:hypothetical protein n=1 Tax=Lewinella sp. LCG006 TaxID=3231911 RepID=UPI00345F76F6
MSSDPRLAIRPQIESLPANNPVEDFLHQTLRPVLKLQNELFLAITRHFFVKRKVRFANMNLAQQKQQVQHSIGKDNRLRGLLFGLVVGQFTEEELGFYLENEAEVNRRITQLLVQRLHTQLERLR